MTVGFIGLGNMGSNMALRLIDRGEKLVVTDVEKDAARPVLEAGAVWVDSPAEVAARSDVVLSSLPGPSHVEAVAFGTDGIIEGIRPGSVYVDLSTSSPLVIRRVHDALSEKNAAAVDSPVSGGPQHCRAGTLTVLAGGAGEDVDLVRPVLEHLAREFIHVGSLGAGYVAKLVNNATGLSTLALLSEVISLGVEAGIDHQTLLTVLKEGAYGQGLFLTRMLPEIAFKHRYDPAGFALDLGRKDIALATSLARELDVPMPIVNLAEQAAVELVSRGCGHKDSTIIFSLQEERAGTVLHDDDAEELRL